LHLWCDPLYWKDIKGLTAGEAKNLERDTNMILVGKETRQSAAQVLARAVEYFGPDGVGLEIAERNDRNVQLRGSGGYVAVRVQPKQDDGISDVEVESREWENDAKRFLEKI
jgi:hypothetical protein